MNRMIAQQCFSSLLRRSAMSLFAVALLLSCAISVDSSDKLNPFEKSGDLILMTFVPREPLGNEEATYFFGDLDFDLLQKAIEAGINCIDGGFVLEYLSKGMASPKADLLEARQSLRRRFVQEMNKYDVFYGHGIDLEGDRIENERFVGGNIYLDEPYAYFPSESFPTGQVKTLVQNRDLATACQHYQKHLEGYLHLERKKGRSGKSLPIVLDSNESVAWYDLKAGVNGFGFEVMGKLYLNQLHYFNEMFGLKIPETPENYVRLAAAFARGASDHFDKPWGMCIYGGTPPGVRRRLLEETYERGATIYSFWAFHEDLPITIEELFDLAAYIKDYARQHQPAKAKANTVVAVPPGFCVPVSIYYNAEVIRMMGREAPPPEKRFQKGAMWNLIDLDVSAKTAKDPILAKMRKLGETLQTLLNSKDEFDIVVYDESLRPEFMKRYQRVIII